MDMRKEEAASRRRRLLDAAIEVVGEVGTERLTMEMVAERADAARARSTTTSRPVSSCLPR